MRALLIVVFTGTLASCMSQNEPIEDVSTPTDTVSAEVTSDPSVIDTAKLGLNLTPKGNYDAVKREIRTARATKNDGKALEDYLLNQIIPHWYGTEWDFNGYTSVPNQGVIACGYFVSTTLEHVGFRINRYTMAQQAGLHEAQTLALGNESNYETIYGIDVLKEKMTSYEDGLYFVGLDNHVGYLYRKEGELYFIHSNYIEDKVMIEKAIYAPAFQSNVYVVAKISTNEDLLSKWRKNEQITVVRP